MKKTLLVLGALCLLLTSSALAQDFVYVYGTYRAKEAPEVIKEAAELVCSHKFRKGFFLKKHVTFILKLEKDSLDTFKAAGFTQLKTIKMQATWARVSNINGWGTEANGEVHRRVNYKWEFTGEELAQAFTKVKGLLDGPRETLENLSQEHFLHIFTGDSVAMFERGFRVSYSVTLTTSEATIGGEATTLLQNGGRTGYYSLR